MLRRYGPASIPRSPTFASRGSGGVIAHPRGPLSFRLYYTIHHYTIYMYIYVLYYYTVLVFSCCILTCLFSLQMFFSLNVGALLAFPAGLSSGCFSSHIQKTQVSVWWGFCRFMCLQWMKGNAKIEIEEHTFQRVLSFSFAVFIYSLT